MGALFEAAHSAPHSKVYLNIGIESNGFGVPIKYNAIWSRNIGEMKITQQQQQQRNERNYNIRRCDN